MCCGSWGRKESDATELKYVLTLEVMLCLIILYSISFHEIGRCVNHLKFSQRKKHLTVSWINGNLQCGEAGKGSS